MRKRRYCYLIYLTDEELAKYKAEDRMIRMIELSRIDEWL